MNEVLTTISDAMWGYGILAFLILCGIYFSIKSRFVQFRHLKDTFKILGESVPSRHTNISSFQAFAVSVATRVGTGNLAGVATAIAIGGPGAVFWMWIIAIIGAASAFIESTLAQLYKRKSDRSYIGGPAYYILHGLHNKTWAVVFAILITVTFGLSYNSIQSNTISSALNEAFGFDPITIGVILAIISLIIVFGGIHRIAQISSVIVPIMAIGYFCLTVSVIAINYRAIPSIFKLIFESAFGLQQFSGGLIGTTILAGIKRGLFSNEAGEGSAPNIAASAHVSHPVKQGLIQMLGVFTDTLLVCSCTAFIILISGIYTDSGMNGIALTQNALTSEIGPAGTTFVAIAILLFAFSSIIGNYYYGEANIQFITNKRWILNTFRCLSAGFMVIVGAISSLDLVWTIGDICMGLLTVVNLVAILRLGKYAFRLLDDYQRQKRQGVKSPSFHANQIPEIADDLDCWKE